MESSAKITASHLSRTGYVYIRQSSAHQVASNTESTLRQYALRDRLLALGWDQSLIQIIDSDLGISGKASDNREGFMRLMADVANGKVGAIACIEASRLSRCSADWARLIEICTMTETLLIDADGIYDPNDFNDRLLLGLKGTMSEAELHFLQERMRGGLLNKAKRGELKWFLPIGYEYDCDDNIIKSPDLRIRETVEQFFEMFRIKKSGSSVVAHFTENNMSFPLRIRTKGHCGEIQWERLNLERAIAVLHNPFYAGAYVYGRHQMKWTPGGKRRCIQVPEEEWYVNIPDHHEAYISMDEFNANQAILKENTQLWGGNEKKTPPREGYALLQGICYCGSCGYRMSPVYSKRAPYDEHRATYVCHSKSADGGASGCHQTIPASVPDEAVSKIIASKLCPEALSLTVQVQEEVSKRRQDHLRYFELQLENARHEEDLARMRYMSVDPTNRLVALQLETEWNKKIRLREQAAETYNAEADKMESMSYPDLTAAAESIGKDFSKVWNNPSVSNEDKKRIIRYLIKDVTLLRTEPYSLKIGICFQGGAITEIEAPLPKPRYMRIATPQEVLDFIEEHAEYQTYSEIADALNNSGLKRECGRPFYRSNVSRIMSDYSIKNMKQRYLERGWISMQEAAARQEITVPTLRYRLKTGNYTGKYAKVEEKGTLVFDPETLPSPAPVPEKLSAQTEHNARTTKASSSKEGNQGSIGKREAKILEHNKPVLEFLEANADKHNNIELANMLNSQGFTRYDGKPFNSIYLNRFMPKNGVRTMKQRYLDRGWLTADEASAILKIEPITLKYRAEHGLYTGRYVVADGNNAWLFDPDTMPKK